MARKYRFPYLADHTDGGFKYQRAVPEKLRPLVGTAMLTKYIGHTTESEAGALCGELGAIHTRLFAQLRKLSDDERAAIIKAGGIDAMKESATVLPRLLDIVSVVRFDPRQGAARLQAYTGRAAIASHDGMSLATIGGQALLEQDMAAHEAALRNIAGVHGALAAKVMPVALSHGWDALFDLWKRKANPRRTDKHAAALALIRECLGERDYRTVTPQDADRFLRWMVDKGVSVPMQHKHRECVSGMFTKAVPLEMALHPFRGVTVDEAYVKAKKHPYEGAEVRRILEMLATVGMGRDYRTESLWAIRTAAFQGCRINEAAQLQRGDVMAKGGVPVVYFRAIDAVTEKSHPEKSIKTGEDRVCALHPALWDAAYQRKHKLPVEDFRKYVGLNKNNGSEFVFAAFEYKDPNEGGKGRAEYLINNMGRFVRDVCGITRPNIQPNHAFRHRFNDAMRNAGWDKDKREAFLGQGGSVNRRYGDGPSLAKISKELRDVNPLSDL